MKYIFISLIIVLSCLPAAKVLAHVERTFYLQGKLGKRAVAIKMLCYDEMPIRHIHYFFQDDKRDRYLVGKLMAGYWHFEAEENETKVVSGQGNLRIIETENKNWKGTWSDSSGKRYDIILTPLLPDSTSSQNGDIPFAKEMDPYEAYRISTIGFEKIKSEKVTKELQCDWYSEKETGTIFFRLHSAKENINTDSINATLKSMNLALVTEKFKYKPDRIAIKNETTILYLTDELLSLQILATTTTTSGKTVQTKQLITLDIKNGEEVNLEDLIWFDNKENKPPANDLFKIYQYRKKFFAHKIFGLLNDLYPTQMKTDVCGINQVDTWILPVWALTHTGITFSFRASEQCDIIDWAVIPYHKLEPFMEKQYHLRGLKK